MKIAILGYGLQGKSSFEYWHKGNEVTICDQNKIDNAPFNAKLKTGENYLRDLAEFDLIVRSPSIYPKDIVSSNDESILDKVTTNTNEFFKVCPSKNIIGVTGTKGKGTTSTLITKMLEADGKTVHLGGNIGTPPLEMLEAGINENDYVVLELANFQLIDIKYSPHIAVCLMVVPEHQDWHEDMEEYVTAKKQLFINQTPSDIAIYYSENEISKDIASSGSAIKIPYFKDPGANIENEVIEINGQRICRTDEVKLLGRHNLQNVCAAITTAWQIDKNISPLKDVVVSFAGLEHRLELVRELNGVKYYDDSFATTPESAIVAIEAFKDPKVIILGGSDKGAEYIKLAKTVAGGNVKHAVLIGDTAKSIEQALKNEGFSDYSFGSKDINEIVELCKEKSSPGDVVLLSTGCASFGIFKDYKDRGDKFSLAVQSLS
ncbi:MAG: UDP-N-acetylmuramoyl-L-alanine--D-glutamate ligase [bacterium]